MPTPRDSLSKLRTSVEALVPRVRAGGPPAIYARAQLKRAEITEEYFVQQEISKNPWTRADKRPVGCIELSVPYDGCEFFTREAKADVECGTSGLPEPADKATIGHLLLRDYAKTNLRDGLQLGDTRGSVPIEVPIGGTGLLDYLSADRQTCQVSYGFDPDYPGVFPAELDIKIYDPDSLDLPSLDLLTPEGRRHVGDVIEKIRQQASFRDELLLEICVRLSIPTKAETGQLGPSVSRVSIGWPTITSLRTLRLRVGDRLPAQGGDIRFRDEPVRYNPVRKRIEWTHIPMQEMPEMQGHDNVRRYESMPMMLSVEHPGELYQESFVSALAEIEIPGYLLSGMSARLYDATGHVQQESPLKLTTKVEAGAELKLDDAFAKREFSPNQHLFFDEIIPDEMRITDIMTALQDSGFDVKQVWPEKQSAQYNNVQNTNWLLVAQRQEGPDSMVLWIFVEGRHFETERETVMHGGGVTHKTKLQSGELRVFIRGMLARESEELTHEMNALQRTLRERYDRVRQRR